MHINLKQLPGCTLLGGMLRASKLQFETGNMHKSCNSIVAIAGEKKEISVGGSFFPPMFHRDPFERCGNRFAKIKPSHIFFSCIVQSHTKPK